MKKDLTDDILSKEGIIKARFIHETKSKFIKEMRYRDKINKLYNAFLSNSINFIKLIKVFLWNGI